DAGACKPKLQNGQPCAAKDACESHICTDGFCCNAPCQGQCEACDVPQGEGACVPVTGIPHGSRVSCAAATPDNPCAEASCDGTVRELCAAYVGPSVLCRPQSCKNGLETLAAGCDGHGQCPDAETKTCEPFVCGASACKTSCAADADCRPGSRCDVPAGKCV